MSAQVCCIRPYYCVECDKRRADREISRLREVLRTTMDQFLDSKEEVKDLRKQRDDACGQVYDLRAQRQSLLEETAPLLKKAFDAEKLAKVGKDKANKAFKALYELQLSVMLAKKGKITICDVKIPPEDEIHYEYIH